MATLKYYVADRHATWLELFFDLVFVASISVIIHHLAHVHDGHIEAQQGLLFVVEFIPIWWIWATHTVYANRFDTDGKRHRLFTLAIVFLMTTMSTFLEADFSVGFSQFIGFYLLIRIILAGMYGSAAHPHPGTTQYARSMGQIIVAGAMVAGIALLLHGPLQLLLFLGGIVLEMAAMVWLGLKQPAVAVHRSHLVERIGLLSIILLGESVISLVNSLRGIEWGEGNVMAAIAGFLIIGAIWWIYFDSFDVLERAKRLHHGFFLLYSHIFFLMGLGLLSSLIGHAILNDLALRDFRVLAILGMTLFYLGKQMSYFVLFPPYRINLVINTLICLTITTASTLLPQPEQMLMGITLGMLFYVYSNVKWTLTKDVTPLLIPATE